VTRWSSGAVFPEEGLDAVREVVVGTPQGLVLREVRLLLLQQDGAPGPAGRHLVDGHPLGATL